MPSIVRHILLVFRVFLLFALIVSSASAAREHKNTVCVSSTAASFGLPEAPAQQVEQAISLHLPAIHPHTFSGNNDSFGFLSKKPSFDTNNFSDTRIFTDKHYTLPLFILHAVLII
ncbi:MAG: hypothetical protein ACOZCO_17880 [Bacteroidota bacterium]